MKTYQYMSVKDLAEIIYRMPNVDYTFCTADEDDETSNMVNTWYGTQNIDFLDNEVFMCGAYGDGAISACTCDDYTDVRDIENCIQNTLDSCNTEKVNYVFLKLTTSNEEV